MNVRAVKTGVVCGALIACFWPLMLWPVPGQKTGKVERQPGNTILMNDGFEYQLADYGVGSVQHRHVEGPLSPPVFWVEFRITNKSEHLLQEPSYVPFNGVMYFVDNWGNTYRARSSQAVYGSDWEPISSEQNRFKPGESRSRIMQASLSEFVEDIHEVYVYLQFPYFVPLLRAEQYHFFVVREPMSRRRDWLRHQAEPPSNIPGVMTGVETRYPAETQNGRRYRGSQR